MWNKHQTIYCHRLGMHICTHSRTDHCESTILAAAYVLIPCPCITWVCQVLSSKSSAFDRWLLPRGRCSHEKLLMNPQAGWAPRPMSRITHSSCSKPRSQVGTSLHRQLLRPRVCHGGAGRSGACSVSKSAGTESGNQCKPCFEGRIPDLKST